MKVTISGDQIAIVSAVTMEELQTLSKYNPAALTLVDKDGNTVYMVKGIPGEYGSINGKGLVYNAQTRPEDGEQAKAALYIIDPKLPKTAAEAKAYVADKYGPALELAAEVEKGIPEAATAATAKRDSLIATIAVTQ